MTRTQTMHFGPAVADIFFIYTKGNHYRVVTERDMEGRNFMYSIGFEPGQPFTSEDAALKSINGLGMIPFDASLLVPTV